MTAEQLDCASNAIRFVLDGRVVSANHLAPTTTVLEYLRETAHHTGTKEGCAEGDCGACTVVLGQIAADGSRVGYRAVNSCIRFLPTIDGCELVTVESLKSSDGCLHPVQQAMVDHHASQCGFCTPGFVMSLFALYLEVAEPDRRQVLDALSGNLCRCTGYRPIIEAGRQMSSYPPPAHWSRNAAASAGRCTALLAIQRDRSLRLPGFRAPRTLDELSAALESEPDALLLAGGTDVGLWVTKQLLELPTIIYIGEIAQLKRVQRDAASIVVGAAVSLTDAWSALVADFPELAEQAQRFGSPPVRNSGTLCGNLGNGSPIGDSLPILMALNAELDLRRGTRTRRVPLERFYRGYRQKDLAPGEFIVSVRVPARSPRQWVGSYKLSKRVDQDISAISAAFVVCVEKGHVAAARIAYGGMADVAARAHAAEGALIGAAWNRSSIDAAAARLADDFQPLTDLRASSAYRLQAAGNLLRRFYIEHSGAAQPTRTAHAAAASALEQSHAE